jgi:hypothetical protein
MRYVLILLLCCLACEQPVPERQPVPVSEDSTFLTGTFFIVRHAQELCPGMDSSLTDSGYVRAGALYRFLKDSAIDRIYIDSLRVSRETAESLYTYLHIDTIGYKPDSTGEGLLYEITRRDDWGKRLLVIGQNYSLLPVVRSLRAKPPVDSMKESDYSSLFIVRKTRDTARCRRTRY